MLLPHKSGLECVSGACQGGELQYVKFKFVMMRERAEPLLTVSTSIKRQDGDLEAKNNTMQDNEWHSNNLGGYYTVFVHWLLIQSVS